MPASAMGRAAAVVSRQGVFMACIMARIADVTPSIARFVSMEVVERLRATLRHRSVITVVRIVAVIDVAIEAMRTVEPGTCSEEHSAHKPVWAVVAIRRAIIRRVVEVTVGAYGRGSDADSHLRRRRGGPAHHRSPQNRASE